MISTCPRCGGQVIQHYACEVPWCLQCGWSPPEKVILRLPETPAEKEKVERAVGLPPVPEKPDTYYMSPREVTRVMRSFYEENMELIGWYIEILGIEEARIRWGAPVKYWRRLKKKIKETEG